MLRPLLVAGLLVSACAQAAPPDARSVPGGVLSQRTLQIVGTDGGGIPVIQRPEIPVSQRVSNGVARQASTGDDRTITYGGRSRGTFGSRHSPIIVTNENGRPILRYPN